MRFRKDVMTRLLCIVAHPDDETMLCGGTLAVLAEDASNDRWGAETALRQANYDEATSDYAAALEAVQYSCEVSTSGQ